jgi:biopolymer transport protein ExbD
MRKLTPHRDSHVGFNMTPMIDVVFLLIIFFLVASHLAKQEIQLELDLPRADSGGQTPDEERPRITVNVLADGQISLGGDAVDAGDLTRRLSYAAERAAQDLEVRIRGDRHVPYRYIEPILLACVRSGIWNITFAVIESDG